MYVRNIIITIAKHHYLRVVENHVIYVKNVNLMGTQILIMFLIHLDICI